MSLEDDWRGRGGRKGNRRFDSGHRRGDKYRFRGGRSGSKGDRGNSSSDGPNKFPRPPPGLRGKEIGLWYRNNARRMKKDKEPVKAEPIRIDLDPQCMSEIWDTLDHVKARPPEYLVRKYKATRLISPNSQDDNKKGGEYSGDVPVDKYSYLEESKFKKSFLNSITGSIEENLSKSLSVKSGLTQDPALDEQLIRELKEKQTSERFRKMIEFRKKLPAFSKKDEILNLVNNNQVVVISGETGCGKTTQVAQFILDNEIMKGAGSKCHIVCTQPRRISAISVAERVADERDEKVGNFGSVGYQIRLEKMLPRTRGSVLFVTTGILLQFMQSNPALTHVSHIIIDEIHERDTLSDFSITILKDILAKRSDLKLILMSATLNAERFSNYYNNCPMLSIPGFTFPVKEYYLEDVIEMTRFDPKSKSKPKRKRFRDKVYEDFIQPHVRNLRACKKYSNFTLDALLDPDIEEINIPLIYSLIYHICYVKKELGAILVFLPGWDKISTLCRTLNESGSFPSSKFLILPLHSMMPTGSQKVIFERPPPGVRKIVVATNIAETSITIDDIVFVIDCGKIKMKKFDIENNISTLNPEWVSIANARQRRGRAGRVQAGVCYHLFSRAREMALDSYPLPEMLRTRLEEVILQAKILQLGDVRSFLKRVLDPPDPVAIDLSLKMLVMMNALDEDESLTPLGYHIAQLPLDPPAAKMILMGSLFSCVDPIFSIAAGLSFKDAFLIPLGKEEEVDKKKEQFDMGRKSDHLVLAEVISQWEAAEHSGWGNSFCYKNFLSRNILFLLKEMKKQFSENLYNMKFLNSKDHKDRESNRNSNNIGLIRAVICSGLLPNVAFITKVKRPKNSTKAIISLRTHEDGKLSIHPKSVNAKACEFESRYLLYHLKLKSSKLFIFDSTMVHPLPLIFFGHSINKYDDKGKTIFELSDLIRFSMSPEVASLITELRIRLDWLLEQKVSNPGVTDWSINSDEGCILRAIAKLITREDRMLMEDDVEDYYDDDDDVDGDDGDDF